MMRWEKVVYTLVIALFVYLVLISMTYNGWGFEYTEKTCTITITKNEMGWCYFGNAEKPTTINNYMDLEDRGKTIDRFLDFLATGQLERKK